MILVDSSAWIEYLRATGSPEHHEVRRLLAENADQVAVTEPVAMELLAGPTDPVVIAALERLLDGLAVLSVVPDLDYRAAAEVHRAARRSGRQVRSLLDCLTAVVAARTGSPVLQHDRDFAVLDDLLVDLVLHPAGPG